MNADQLQRYLFGILQMELDIYVQKNAVAQLTRRYHNLGIRHNLNVPQLLKPNVSLMGHMIGAGLISGIIGGIYGLVAPWPPEDFFDFMAIVISAVLYAVVALLGGGALLGFAAWLVRYLMGQKKEQERYEERLKVYESDVRKQKARIERETAQKNALAKEIYSLQDSLKASQMRLSEAYDFGILDPEYRNIYAVSSFYGYLTKGRTYTLQFNEETGDQGAYNLYENECRLNRIITNTEAILDRLDQVVQYQHDLAMGLQAASQQIESLCKSVNGQISRISESVRSIERCQNVIAYNSECARRDVEFLTWMHMFY